VSVRKGPRLSPQLLRPYLVEVPPYRTDLPAPPAEAFDWPALFGNANPVEVEVGFGKGLFLLNAGAAHPEVNYFGIEIVRKYQLFAANRLAQRGLTNVRVTCADARYVLRDRVASGSVRAVHLYFPDPWWKSRHHKRRVFTPELARECERVLMPGGRLLVVTDVADYAAMVRETVAGVAGLREAAPPAEGEPAHDMDYLTHHERKFRKEGREIYRMAFERV
jgi:tRNA (guanine-N7-)-methyltransferase